MSIHREEHIPCCGQWELKSLLPSRFDHFFLHTIDTHLMFSHFWDQSLPTVEIIRRSFSYTFLFLSQASGGLLVEPLRAVVGQPVQRTLDKLPPRHRVTSFALSHTPEFIVPKSRHNPHRQKEHANSTQSLRGGSVNHCTIAMLNHLQHIEIRWL